MSIFGRNGPVGYCLFSPLLLYIFNSLNGRVVRGGGGHSGTEGGRTRVTYFAEEGVFFLRPPHVRDVVKEGYFFVPRYEVLGSKSPYNPRNIRGSDAE